jgi:predicted nucleic acid-binding protein
MRAFLETSVLVATFYGDHEHHERSFELFVGLTKKTGFVAAHSLAETYSVITGMPGKNKVSPDEALLFIDDVRERVSVVSIEPITKGNAQAFVPPSTVRFAPVM